MLPIDNDPTTSADAIQSGIYQIRCLKNGKVYIGSAVDIKSRWSVHLTQFKKGIHHSRHLQKAWTKHGGHAFVFEVLEAVADKTDLICKEQEWLDRIRPFDRKIGYNISPTAGSTLGVKPTLATRRKQSKARKGWKQKPESIKKTADALRGRKRPPEVGAKVSASKKGKKPKPLTPAQRANLSAALRGREKSAEHRANLSASLTGRKLSPSHAEKSRCASKGYKQTEDHIARRTASRRANHRANRDKGQMNFNFPD